MNKQELKNKIINTLTDDFKRIYGVTPSPIIINNILKIIEKEL